MKNENRLGIQIIYQVGIVLKDKWGGRLGLGRAERQKEPRDILRYDFGDFAR